MIYALLIFFPQLAVTVRRLHDIGKSGVLILIVFIPFIGSFWLLILSCMEGQSRNNRWGIDPKGKGVHNLIDQIGKE